MANDMPELGGIPNYDQVKVSKSSRRKQIAAATTEGDSNRHLASQKRDANLGMTIWGLANVDCIGTSDYKLKGMRTPIRGWQLQAAARMVMRENADDRPHGGILGDQMGMGKTLTSLVLIVGCPPLPQDIQAGRGGTLVVVPGPNVLKEWTEAISQHTDYFHNAVKNTAGPLFGIEWYRVVFDELHTIKNSETQKIYPYVKLIGVEGVETKKEFNKIYKKGPNASKKLDALINLITIRRSHEDKFLGKQMLEGLPQFDAEVRWVNLSQEEQLIYE
ncbi:putative global transcription activator SNF2L2 [Colletotrichum spaethianum]|uniref:Global transcription activator SNF2L2 n=1 Tax=Colletotrichum spaethianum TaxID=700344 RepID=A0AA37P613_9PEZI|nr:putative global transcription activator SNF2L2 [Colletotrichum spaethianum]GKT45216.1 putative global transcription activator SNF2L2 [Colletotrichum spaethianum]